MPEQAQSLPAGFIERLRKTVSESALITDRDKLVSYLYEQRGHYQGNAAAVLLPEDTEELANAVTLCAECGVPVVPQGGNTGLVGGAVTGAGELLVSLRRMNRIREVDPINFTITVEAGAILADVQQAAATMGCYFPLSLAAEGSCTIGGNLASNAGGVGVLRYGNARELTLGLEVVLSDGRIWDGMRPLYKDNTGYSLNNLFIGSEGTLGIISAAILKLFPENLQQQTALCALKSVDDALALLSLARKHSGDLVTAFELMSEFSLGIVCAHGGGTLPFRQAAPWYVLIELSTSRPGSELRPLFETLLNDAHEQGLVDAVAIAESMDQQARLWALRERISETQKHVGGSIKHDISVPISRIPEFIATADAAVSTYMTGIRVCAFGHLGDGNIHYNLSQPTAMDEQTYLDHRPALNDVVHGIVHRMNGSISAEHGIGLLKVDEIKRYRGQVEQDLIERLKRALDPDQQMNPGKLV